MLRGYVSVYERRDPVTSLLEDLVEVVQQVVQQVVIGRQVRSGRGEEVGREAAAPTLAPEALGRPARREGEVSQPYRAVY